MIDHEMLSSVSVAVALNVRFAARLHAQDFETMAVIA
jgi:hypothetical protein